MRNGKGARYDGLAGDDRRDSRKEHKRQASPVWSEQIEGVDRRMRIAQQERALAHIIEDQARIDEGQPGKVDRLAAEMTHVGIKRFCAGNTQDDRAER